MSFTTAITRVSANGDGVSISFTVPWLFYANTDLLVIMGGVTQSLGVQFNATGAGVGSGTVTFITAPPVGVGNVQIILNDPLTQTANFVDGTAFPSNTLNQVNDRAVQISSRLYDLITRALRAPDGDASPAMLLPPAAQRANTYQTYDALGNSSNAVGLVAGTILSAASIGAFTGPATTAELATGVTVVAPWLPFGNLQRFGIAANNAGAALANSTILAALFNSTVAAGPTGLFFFPNNGAGSPDTYYFSTIPIQIRDGINLDGNDCNVNFSGAFNPAMNTYGFFTCVRDVTIQNMTITINYNGTGGTNNGNGIRVGSRSGYPFGIYSAGIFDQDDLVAHGLPLQGGVTLQNLRINSNNPSTTTSAMVLALGGLRNFTMKGIAFDGQNAVKGNAFYYEYGWASTNGSGAQNLWTSSHMTASSFTNITVSNMATGGTSQGFGMNGAYGCTVSDINIITADQGLGFGAGESFFYRTWALDGVTQRILNLRDITVKACPIGVIMGGAQPISGYLSAILTALPTPAKYQAQTDFLNYTLDGFSLSTPAGTAIIASGAQVTIRNGACNGGGICLSGEAIHSTIENVQINGASGPNGIRYDFPSPATIWTPARPVFTKVKNSKITGSTGVGIALGACQSAIIENNQIGANLLYDVAAEATQTNGVNIALTSFGVRCRNNFISTAGGAVAYQNVNNNVNTNNSIESELNLQTAGGGGAWITDFQSPSAQTLTNGATIIVASLRTVRVTEAGNVTGILMPVGYAPGLTVTLVNEANFTITFAASGTSRVAAGVSVVVAGLTKMILVWDSATNLWY